MIRHLFFGLSDQPELGRCLWALGVVAMIGYQGFAIWWIKQSFSAVEFGTGLASILLAGGFGVAAKDTGVSKAKARQGEA